MKSTSESLSHPETSNGRAAGGHCVVARRGGEQPGADLNLADSHFDFLGYRFQRSKRGKMLRLIRPKSLRKLRESIKLHTSRKNGTSMGAIVADLNRTLSGWFRYFKYAKASELSGIDGWIRMRLRSILRKRRGLEGRGRGKGHQRWPNRYFKKLRLFCLLDAREH